MNLKATKVKSNRADNLYRVTDGDRFVGYVMSRSRMWTHYATTDESAEVPQPYRLVYSAPSKAAALMNLEFAAR